MKPFSCRALVASKIRLKSVSTLAYSLAIASITSSLVFPSTVAALPTPVTGINNVSVELHPGVLPTSSLERREHVAISDTLANDLGLTIVLSSSVNPQVRVVIDSPAVAGFTSSANFTVIETFPDINRTLRIYEPLNNTDKNNGVYKLFVTSDPLTVNFPLVDATLYPVTPSTTTVHENGLSTAFDNFAEANPGTSQAFTEEVTVSSDKRAVLLVPHGGNIELNTSDTVAPVLAIWDNYSIQGNVWDAHGTWGSSQTYKRWHITSSALDPASHPGLEYMLEDPGYEDGRKFKYALSVHGFDWSDQVGLLIGGRANTHSKCFVLKTIRRYIKDQYSNPKYALSTHIFDVNGSDWAFSGADGLAPNDSGLAGLSTDNIVNRLSPNASGTFGHGGIQLELSDGLRDDDALRDIVAKGAADAIAQLATVGPKALFCHTL